MSSSLTPSELENYGQSKQHVIVGCLVMVMVLGNFSVGAKIVVQRRDRPILIAEDYCLLVALASSNAVCALYLAAVHYGLGLHVYRVIMQDPHVPNHLVHEYMSVWFPSVLNAPVFGGIKFALLFLYRRLFLIHQKWLKIAWWANVVYLVFWLFGSFFFYLLSCSPPSYYWNRLYATYGRQDVKGSCHYTPNAEAVLTLIFAVIQDFAILLLPITALAGLQIESFRKKLSLIGLFSLGLVACILEVARVVELSVKTGSHDYGKRPDPTWELANFIIMTCTVEMLGITCACLPVIAPWLLKKYRQAKTSVISLTASEIPRDDRHLHQRSHATLGAGPNIPGDEDQSMQRQGDDRYCIPPYNGLTKPAATASSGSLAGSSRRKGLPSAETL